MSPNLDPAAGSPTGIWSTARDWLAEGPVALATVVETWGSSPVPPGGQMVVDARQRFAGSVSGGCIESEIILACGSIIAEAAPPRLLEFGVENETAWQFGLPCGGRIRVLVERLEPESGTRLVDAALEAHRTRRPLLVATRLADGRKTLHRPGETMAAPLAALLAAGRSGEAMVDDETVFAHAITPGPRIVIVGATHAAQALTALARIVGIDCIVVDPRETYATRDRFGDTDLRIAWPGEVIRDIGLDGYSGLAALSHVAEIDDEALAAALATSAAYIGALGSSRNHARRRERLIARGFTAGDIDRIRAPIGLDIGARTPPEIAVSILAEIMLVMRGPRRTA